LIAGALVGLNWKLPHRSLIWIGSGLVSGSAFVIIPAIVALVLKIPQRITISADYINTALAHVGSALHYILAGLRRTGLRFGNCLSGWL
jgi:hypothetical protein